MSYPKIERAAELMIQDSGAENTGSLFVPTEALSAVSLGEGQPLEDVEKFLSELSAEDFETFCIGDEADQGVIAQRGGDTGRVAHAVLDELFMAVLDGEV